MLSIDGQKVAYEKALDIPMGGLGVYNLDVTPEAATCWPPTPAAGSGHADTITVIAAAADPPRAVDHVTPWATARGIRHRAGREVGRDAAAARFASAKHERLVLSAATAARAARSRQARGTRGSVNALPAGGVPEGIAFSPDSQYVYVGNYVDKNVQVYRIVNGKLTDTGARSRCPASPPRCAAPRGRGTATVLSG